MLGYRCRCNKRRIRKAPQYKLFALSTCELICGDINRFHRDRAINELTRAASITKVTGDELAIIKV